MKSIPFGHCEVGIRLLLLLTTKKAFMKKILIASALLMGSYFTYAQQPSPDPDTLKNPVKQIDPEVRQQPADIQYVEERERIAADELPSAVLDSLKAAEPSTWEKSVVYRDKKQNIFIVEVREGGQEKTYRFNREGGRLKNLDEKQNNKKKEQ
jgi:hypothetical protein